MTNPSNSIGTNGAFGGRTSVNAFNDCLGGFSSGILSGWNCEPNSGLTVSIGGDGVNRDVAIAVDNAGNKTSINNISNSPINVTIGAAPATSSRIDAIVAYVDNPPMGTSTTTDNPSACGLIVVEGTVASTPVNPTDVQIRSGITADGASGTTAYYVVIAYIAMASGTTDITANEITQGTNSQIEGQQIASNAITTPKINSQAVTADKIDFSTFGTIAGLPTASTTIVNAGNDMVIRLARIGNLVLANGTCVSTGTGAYDQSAIATTVPSGYRPSTSVVDNDNAIYVPFVSTSRDPAVTGGWTIKSDGSMLFSNGVAFTSVTRFMYNGCWITDDAFPS